MIYLCKKIRNEIRQWKKQSLDVEYVGVEYSTILDETLPLVAQVAECPSKGTERYPLHVVRCRFCGHVQLRETLEQDLYKEYLYTPSYVSGFAEYVEKFADTLRSYMMILQKELRKKLGT